MDNTKETVWCINCGMAYEFDFRDKKPCPYCGKNHNTRNPQDVAKLRPLESGTVIRGRSGREYTIRKIHSRGGGGILYLATYSGEWFAVKECFPLQCSERLIDSNTIAPINREDFNLAVDKFEIEYTTLDRVSACNGIRLEDECLPTENYSNYYYVMTYIPGKTWAGIYKEPLGYKEASLAMTQLLDKLLKIHAMGIYHRDLKPENILQTDDGRLYLIDFGNVKISDTEESIMTVNGVGISNYYVSPELENLLRRGVELNPVSVRWPEMEAYSLAKIFLRLIAGERKFEEIHHNSVMKKKEVEKVIAGLPNGLKTEIFEEGLFKYPFLLTPQRMDQLFKNALNEREVIPIDSPLDRLQNLPLDTPPSSPTKKPRKKWLIYLVLGLIVLIVVISNRNKDNTPYTPINPYKNNPTSTETESVTSGTDDTDSETGDNTEISGPENGSESDDVSGSEIDSGSDDISESADITDIVLADPGENSISVKIHHYLMSTDGKKFSEEKSSNAQVSTDEDMDLTSLASAFKGFTLLGGSLSEVKDPVSAKFNNTASFTADGPSEVYLYYSRNKYSVELKKGTGISKVSGSGEFYYGSEVTVTGKAKEGYTFVDWTKDSKSVSTEKQYTFAMPAGNITLKANAAGQTINVSFDSVGGSSVKTVSCVVGDTYSFPKAPEKTGYKFAGWYTGKTGGERIKSGDTVTATSDFVLYARWAAGTDVEFKINHYLLNENGSGYSLYSTDTQYGETDQSLKLLSFADSFTGFTYLGGSAGTGSSSTPGSFVSESTILPGGNRVLNLYYDRNVYRLNLTCGEGISDVYGQGFYYYGQTVTINCSLYSYYDFAGWTGDVDNGSQSVTFTMPAEDITITAKGKTNSYTVYFNAGEGSVSESSRRLKAGATLTDMPVPTRSYYTFGGWYDSVSGNRIYDGTLSVTDRDITLNAHWIVNEESDWVSASNVPAGAQITSRRWDYTTLEKKESSSASESGWERTGEEWRVKESNSVRYASFPSGYDTGNWYYQNYAKEPYYAYEDSNYKREVSNSWTCFIYWHWMYNVSYASTTQRAISHRSGSWDAYGNAGQGFYYGWFCAFDSSVDCPYLDRSYCCSQNLPSYNCVSVMPDKSSLGTGTPRFFRFDVYTSSYTDYTKVYFYQKSEKKTSTSEVSVGGNIVSVEQMVKYRKK